jgi:hypothetical protein
MRVPVGWTFCSRAEPRASTLVAGLLLLAAACAKDHGSAGSPEERDAASAEPGATPLPDAKAHVGAQAFVTLLPVDEQASPEQSFEGHGTFAQTSAGVDLQLDVGSCVAGSDYQLAILAGSDCSADTLRGSVWQQGGGDQIPRVGCFIVNHARLSYTRESRHAKPWTIGTPTSSNLLGHALVLRGPDGAPLLCGVITQAPDAAPTPMLDPKTQPKPELTAVAAGICVSRTFVRDSARGCPDPKELSACASEHCGLDACVQKCADFLQCLATVDDPCEDEYECKSSDECTDCRADVGQCTFRFCTEQIACAPPSAPDGPCAQLQACCAMQGEGAASCLEFVRLFEKLSGDASCIGAMHDWDFNVHLRVPCKFQ